MRKIILLCLLSAITMPIYSKTCPSASDILVKRSDSQYDVVAPPGFRLIVNEKHPAQKNIAFLIAAWGDHKHESDPVRCHYYRDFYYDHVQIETIEQIPESRITSHSGWGTGELYHLCRSNNVNDCSFG